MLPARVWIGLGLGLGALLLLGLGLQSAHLLGELGGLLLQRRQQQRPEVTCATEAGYPQQHADDVGGEGQPE